MLAREGFRCITEKKNLHGVLAHAGFYDYLIHVLTFRRVHFPLRRAEPPPNRALGFPGPLANHRGLAVGSRGRVGDHGDRLLDSPVPGDHEPVPMIALSSPFA